jgi:subtilase family serine protease
MMSPTYATAAFAAFAFAFATQAAGLPALAAPAPAYVDTVAPGAHLHDLGRTAASKIVHLAFNVRYQHQDELDRDALLINSKGSPLYHHFLTNREWNAYFAPSVTTVRTVLAELRNAGFHVTSVSADRGLIDASARADAVERFFGTELHAVAQPGAGTRYRHTTPATLPPSLRPFIDSVTGLNNIQLYRPRPMTSRGAQPDKIKGPITGPDGGYGPRVLANGFKYPVQKGSDGTGHTVGVTIAGDIADSDLSTYLSYFQITQTGTVTREPVDGAQFGPEVETTLDVETISGLAPGTNIIIYQFPDWTVQYINDTFNQVVSDNTVDSYSNSWAWCETADQSLWDNTSIHRIFKHSVAKGQTPIFASGDDGAFTRGCSGLAVASPADDPYVVGAGGLTIGVSSKGKLTSQIGWSDGGGGVSVVWKLPKYQNGVPGVLPSGRNVPDIALPADVQDSWYFEGGWDGPIGGTSWAAPAFNAMLVEIDEARNSRAGWVNADLYAAAAQYGSKVFYDVTSGNNGYYSAGPGYDQVTGLGAPQGTGLAADL